MKLQWNDKELCMNPVSLHFEENLIENVFAKKNNKTLNDTLKHKRYKKLNEQVIREYTQYLNWGLGEFLLYLKSNGDNFYLKFLNKYGDQRYSWFYIKDEQYLNKKGIYIYAIKGDIKYIGRCRDSFKKRINLGYGKIHPKNCYLDGQATNCHLNSLITEHKEKIKFLVNVMKENDDIEQIEKHLIMHYNPPWNIGLKPSDKKIFNELNFNNELNN